MRRPVLTARKHATETSRWIEPSSSTLTFEIWILFINSSVVKEISELIVEHSLPNENFKLTADCKNSSWSTTRPAVHPWRRLIESIPGSIPQNDIWLNVSAFLSCYGWITELQCKTDESSLVQNLIPHDRCCIYNLYVFGILLFWLFPQNILWSGSQCIRVYI